MTRLLRIDTSARTQGSHTRALGDAFEIQWQNRFPDTHVIRRDLAAEPVPQISEATVQGFYTAPVDMTDALRAATAVSDQLIDELMAADALMITVPIYNFSIPAALKAWIDQIVRAGRTFAFDGTQFTGLVTGKPVFVMCAYGVSGYAPGGPLASADFLKPYLRQLFNFLGCTEVHFYDIQGAVTDPATAEKTRAASLHAFTAQLAA